MILKSFIFIAAMVLAAGCFAFKLDKSTVIVVDKNAVPAEQTAAQELQKYLQKVFCANIELQHVIPKNKNSIIIGTGKLANTLNTGINFSSLKPDEVIFKTISDRVLLITGAKPRGTLYSVYEFLEQQLGIRFYAWDCEKIPKKESIKMEKLDYRYASPFIYRDSYSEITCNHMLWSTKMRLNGCCFRKKIPINRGKYFKMGLGHSLINKYVSPKKFFKQRPEWYAYRKKGDKRVNKQLCLSNPETVSEIIREIQEEQAKMPNRKYIAFSMADNGLFCQCEKCHELSKKYETTGATLWFTANKVAKVLKTKYPDVKLAVLAYWLTERPPVGLKLEDNICVVLAMLDRNHGLSASATPRHNIYLKEYCRLTNNKVFIWDYYTNFSNFLLPMGQLNILQPAIQAYKRNKVKGVFAQLPFGSLADFLEYKNYLYAKLLWNPDLNTKELMKEFFDYYYGAASGNLMQYVNLLDTASNRQKGTWVGCYHDSISHWLKPEDIIKANQLIDDALAHVKNNPAVYKRVMRFKANVILALILDYNNVRKIAASNNFTLKTRAALIDQLEQLGKEYKCKNYKEWDNFSKLIKRLHNKKTRFKQENKKVVFNVPLNKIQGNHKEIINGVAISRSRQLQTAFNWMDLKEGLYYEINAAHAGTWDVSITVRCEPLSGNSPAAAYVGIFAPYEAARQAVSGAQGDRNWNKIYLGRYYLPAGSKIWIMPGVLTFVPQLELKSITLTNITK